MEDINYKHLTSSLIKSFIQELDYLSEEEKRIVARLGITLYGGDLKELYNINECIVKEEKSYEGTQISYKEEEDKHQLIINEDILFLEKDEVKEIVVGIIDILEDILPLGSVVRLKKEYMKKLLNNSELEDSDVEVVIVNRFIFKDGINAYFPYAGVIYPVGFIGNADSIQFSSALIDEVIHRGFSNEKDDVYKFLLKKELIVDKKMHSFGFATEEERDKYNRIIKGE